MAEAPARQRGPRGSNAWGRMSVAGIFKVVNDKTLCEAIEATEQSLVYVAPGVRSRVLSPRSAVSRSMS